NLMEKLIIRKHGTPKEILTDNGLEFANGNVQRLCNIYGIKKLFNPLRHHEGVGACE
ncbi:hypothetical protein COBT_002559, partial [Conglomerata obtusa]